LTKGNPRPTPLGSPEARGLYPSGTLARTLRPRNQTEPRHGVAPAQGLGACPGFRLLIDDTPKLGPWLLPGLRRQPRPEHKKTTLEPSGLRGSKMPHPGVALLTTSVTGSHIGHDIRRQASCSLQGLGGSWAYALALKPTSFATKKTPKGTPSQHHLTRRVSKQSSWATPKASLAPRHHHGP
jgi:hypothetical protein